MHEDEISLLHKKPAMLHPEGLHAANEVTNILTWFWRNETQHKFPSEGLCMCNLSCWVGLDAAVLRVVCDWLSKHNHCQMLHDAKAA